MKRRFVFGAVGLSVLGLAACSSGSSQADYQTACMFETRAPGAYSATYQSGSVTEVTPVYDSGATDAGAAQINACIRARAAADGVSVGAA